MCVHLVDCKPYALFTRWKMSNFLHRPPMSSTLNIQETSKPLCQRAQSGLYYDAYLSGARGAKQLVVEKTHAIFLGSSSLIFSTIAPTSVRSSSLCKRFSSITGVKPVVDFHLVFIAWCKTINCLNEINERQAVMIDLMHDFWSIRGPCL
jgi:hypothetical protein